MRSESKNLFLKTCLVTILLLVASAHAQSRPQAPALALMVSELPSEQMQELHYALIKTLVALDQKQASEKAGALKRATSMVFDFALAPTFATAGERCFFGGWISVKTAQSCQRPWTTKNNKNFSEQFAGHLYESEVSCGANHLMRCNPLLFGASTEEGGKCLAMNPEESLTQRCFEASRSLAADHLKLLQEDEIAREKYSELLSEVMNHCAQNQETVECFQLSRQIDSTLKQIKAQGDAQVCRDILEPIMNTENYENIVKILNTPPKISPEKWAPPLDVDPNDVCAIAGLDSDAQANCRELLASSEVPANALLFALEGLKRNAQTFETNKCFDKANDFENVFGHYSTPGLGSKNELVGELSGGIKNKCSFIINDYDERISTHGGAFKCKAMMYHIDLCQSEAKVKKSYSYLGYGTCKNNRGFVNKSGEGTTLLGMSVTSNKSFGFAKQDAQYNAIRKRLGGEVPAVTLFGLQNSNNRSSADYKYLHVGAYTSAGCPSIDEKDAWMIKDLAAAGPSLVVGYKEGQMEAFEKCGDE